MPQSRQLAAIMFADIMGYTAMMQEDETYAMQLRHKFKSNLESEVSAHFGSILEFRGDGAMCSFSSTIEAVKASLNIQISMQSYPVVPLRIGLHTGDVIFEENNIYGDGVNIASRMESFALPGSILISGKAFDDIKNQKDIKALSLGKFALKNVKEPVEIFAISHPGIIIPESNRLEGKGEKAVEKKSFDKSIAVLPFINMSNDPKQEYFSDGMSEEIINSLAHLKELRVAGRTSSFHFKGKNSDLRKIGEKLNVQSILEGSVRKQGNKLRITVQLINVADGFHLWSEKFDREIDDIFTIQDEIAFAITEKLKITLLEKEKAVINKDPTENKEAYDLYLKGRFYYNKRGINIMKGLEYFQLAAEKDPNFVLAYSGIADSYSILGFYSIIPANQAMPKAKQNAEKALALDGSNVEAFTTLAFINAIYDWDWAEAKKKFQLAIEMNPQYAAVHYWYSYYLCFVESKFEESIKLARKASEHLEPLVSLSHHVLAVAYICARKYDEAMEASKMAIELDPTLFPGYRTLGISYAMQKKYEESIEAFNNAALNSSRHSWILVELCCVYSMAGRATEAQEIMDELVTRSHKGFMSGMFVAAYYLKEYDKSIEYLELAIEKRDGSLISMKTWPFTDFVNTDPRFKLFLKRLNFPD
ncbi:MAG: hypothetical protein JJE22_05995 [Bacteroidia bacterium]|nr:hypothetical protein [Bacteroidia bacterium]